MAACPYCHQDPGDGPRCENCGEMLYRYATEPLEEPEEPTPPVEPTPSYPPPNDPSAGDPFGSTRPPTEPVGTGPRLNVPSTPPPVPPQHQSPGGFGGDDPSPGQYAPKQASSGRNGCAIAAIVLGVLLLLAVIGLFVAGASIFEQAADEFDFDQLVDELEDEGTSFATGDQINWGQVNIGDCINFSTVTELDEDTVIVSTLERVACTDLHDAEVYELGTLPGGTWPGFDAMYSLGAEICDEAFAPYVGVDYYESLYFYEVYTPSAASWDAGDRTVACTLFDIDGPLDKPLRGSGE